MVIHRRNNTNIDIFMVVSSNHYLFFIKKKNDRV